MLHIMQVKQFRWNTLLRALRTRSLGEMPCAQPAHLVPKHLRGGGRSGGRGPREAKGQEKDDRDSRGRIVGGVVRKREKEPKRKRGRMPIKQARMQEERARAPAKSQGGDTHGYKERARSLSRRHP